MKFTKLAAAITLGLAFSAAHAVSPETKNFNVKITITGTCAATEEFKNATVADIDFGSVPSANNAAEVLQNNGTTNTLTVQCTSGSSFNVGLKPASATSGASTGLGSMVSGPNTIAYQLKKPTLTGSTYAAGTAASANWGDQAGTSELAVTGQGMTTAIKLPVTAVIPVSALNVPVGNYSEQVTATLTY
jgi:spore coat protein U-like protein